MENLLLITNLFQFTVFMIVMMVKDHQLKKAWESKQNNYRNYNKDEKKGEEKK